MAVTVKGGGKLPDEAPTLPEGLPATSTPGDRRTNAYLLWMACREIAIRDHGKFVTRGDKGGYLVDMNVMKIMADMWDGFDTSPIHVPSRVARQNLYKLLRETQNMVCEKRYAGGGIWWIADKWNPTIASTSLPGLTFIPTTPTPDDVDDPAFYQPVESKWHCVYPGCVKHDEFSTVGMGIHLRHAHDLSLAEYKAMASGATPWPQPEPVAAVTSVAWKGSDGDPVAAVQALLEEVNRARSLSSDDGLVAENLTLRKENEELRKANAKLRAQKEAADRAFGRR